MKRKFYDDCCEDLTGCKNPRTSQGNQTISIGVNEEVQVNLKSKCWTKCVQTEISTLSQATQCSISQATVSKSVQTSHLNFDTYTISIQTTPLVFRHVSVKLRRLELIRIKIFPNF